MIKRVKKRSVFLGAFFQIALIVSMSFALAFLMSDNFVNGTPTMAISSVAGGGAAAAHPVTIIDTGSTEAQATRAGSDTTGGTFTQGLSKLFKGTWAQSTIGPELSGLLAGAAWGVVAYGVVYLLSSMLGLDKGLSDALEYSLTSGAFVAGTLHAFAGNGAFSGAFASHGGAAFFGTHWFATGLIVAAVVFILTYKESKTKTVVFTCSPYEPPLGGTQCDQCNKDAFRPCSEYRCRSLGQACQLLNPGTGHELCAWVGRNDVNSPTITPWDDALSPNNGDIKLAYQPDTAIRPPAIGTKIVRTDSSDGCLPAFTPLHFGILNNKPAQCKIDYNHTDSYDAMQYYMGDTNYYLYNHTQVMNLPGATINGSGPQLYNGDNFALYVRCRDANNNSNVDEYQFRFCVDKSADVTPPVIEDFSVPSGSYVSYGNDNMPISLYTNKPADCKWSVDSKAYSDMENTMQCDHNANDFNANLQYTCTGNLTGIQDRTDNVFYFRCEGQPDKPDNERYANVQSKQLIIRGSQPLYIVSASPNDTMVTGSTDTIKVDLQVETGAGASDGNATCSFKNQGAPDASFITMFETQSYKHKQTLTLPSGVYNTDIRCIDAGGNVAETNISFSVYTDKVAPVVTRVYKQDALKIVTDENASCSYSLKDCNFNFIEGLKMQYSDPSVRTNSFADWNSGNVYYIKCMDDFGNQPDPNQCSIVASAIQLSGNSTG